jgi:hypothetical protein
MLLQQCYVRRQVCGKSWIPLTKSCLKLSNKGLYMREYGTAGMLMNCAS